MVDQEEPVAKAIAPESTKRITGRASGYSISSSMTVR